MINEETDASVRSKRNNRSPSPLEYQDTQTPIVMADRKDTYLTL